MMLCPDPRIPTAKSQRAQYLIVNRLHKALIGLKVSYFRRLRWPVELPGFTCVGC